MILTKYLNMKKVGDKVVPKNLTSAQKKENKFARPYCWNNPTFHHKKILTDVDTWSQNKTPVPNG
jgi:hypothetical protein